jgi:hypothetical protein
VLAPSLTVQGDLTCTLPAESVSYIIPLPFDFKQLLCNILIISVNRYIAIVVFYIQLH